jgi:hypothetical protein
MLIHPWMTLKLSEHADPMRHAIFSAVLEYGSKIQ